jgi:hypothetical protein
MPYTPTDWVDNSTPVNALNMDHIEQGIVDAHAGLPPSPSGQDGKWLTVSGGAMVWQALPASGIQASIVDAKGDLIVGTAADTVARLAVGAVLNHVLAVDSSQASGMRWRSTPVIEAVFANIATANVDIASQSLPIRYIQVYPNAGGSLRSIGIPPDGGRIILQNVSSPPNPFTLLNAVAGGSGAQIATRSTFDTPVPPNGIVELAYDGQYWREVMQSFPWVVDKGDLLVGQSFDKSARLGIGSNDQVLTADSAQALGVKWATPAAGGVTKGCLLVSTQLIAITTAFAAISWTSAASSEEYDPDGWHDPVGSPTLITVPAAGTYLVTAVGSGSQSNFMLRLMRNTSTELHRSTLASSTANLQFATQVRLSANDTLSLEVQQSANGNLQIGARFGVTPL